MRTTRTCQAPTGVTGRMPHAPMPAEYAPHRPEQTLLYRCVEAQLPAFLARHRERPIPNFAQQELRAFLRCGVPAFGFLRLRCDACKLERLVPFSCKRRGFCPSCGGRRMADTSAHLLDRVWPRVPIRQWVLTLPYALRYRCAYDASLTSQVLRAFLRSLFAELRRRAHREHAVRAQQCGSITFVQRFGSAMNLNLHFHTLALDGAYLYEPHPERPPEFVALAPPTSEDVARVLAGTARRLRRLLEARLEDADEDALARDQPLLARLAHASVRSRIATGPEAGQRWLRLGDRVEPGEAQESGRPGDRAIARHYEMSLHAEVAVPAGDRRRLERLCRYVARPPIARDRLAEVPDGSGRLALRLKSRWRDGTTHVLIEPADLIDRLVPLIPPPRTHQARYHGILAPGASLRSRVVPGHAPDTARTGEPPGEPRAPSAQSEPSALEASMLPRSKAHRMRWADLLMRVFAVDALRCPRCGATLRLLAAIENPAVARAILACTELPARAPPEPMPPAELDVQPEPAEAFEFDQSSPYED
ncbi:MAG: transposase [bacterium]|nr:transposase [bacterium]